MAPCPAGACGRSAYNAFPAPTLDPRDLPGNTIQGRGQGSEVDKGNPPGSLHCPNVRARGGGIACSAGCAGPGIRQADPGLRVQARREAAVGQLPSVRQSRPGLDAGAVRALTWVRALGFMPRPPLGRPYPTQEDGEGGRELETVSRVVVKVPGTGPHEARASLPLCGRTLGLPMLARSGSCP